MASSASSSEALSGMLAMHATLMSAPSGDTNLEHLTHLTRLCAGSTETKVRCAALRVARSIARTSSGVSELNRKRFHLLTIRCLEQGRFAEERVLALKLVKQMSLSGEQTLPRTIVRSLVSIASHRDDALKESAVECIREISMIDIRAVAECGGVPLMVSAIVEPTMGRLADSLVLTLLHLLNDSSTRAWLRPSLDMAALLAPFTGTPVEGDDGKLARQACRRAIVTMMTTWTGLLVLSSDPQGLRSLVQTLVQPVALDVRRDVLETVLDIFNTINPLRAPSFSTSQQQDASFGAEPFMAFYWGVGPGAAGSKELAAGGFHAERVPGRHAHMHTLLDNYLVMVLLAFVQCGLVEALVELSVTTSDMARMATQLLSFVSRFSTRLLPGVVSRRLLSQRKLVTSAVDAARSGEVLDRARAQRAAHVISLLSRIVGSGYDTALATLLARSTYEDGVALSSELALAGCSERAHLNLGVFPKSVIVQKSSVHDALVAAAKNLGADKRLQDEASQQQLPQRRNSRFSLTIRGISRRFTNPPAPAAGPASSNPPTPSFASEAEGHASSSLAAPLVANRGHRRLVQQLVLTDLAHGQTSEDLRVMLDRARILIKAERREWAHWDWPTIDQLLSGPLQSPQVCAEVLKTKFFHRLAQFYAVNRDGYFASLPWEPDNVAYTNVASSMLRVLLGLVDLPEARDFLADDRRGRLMAQIAEALTLELRHAEDPEMTTAAPAASPATAMAATFKQMREHHPAHARGLLPAVTSANAANNNAAAADDDEEDDLVESSKERVFTPLACATTMARDFFVLLGVTASHPEGVRMLERLGVFETLDRLSHFPDKDYILRLVISHLDFGGPTTCRTWLQIRMVDKKISTHLRHFVVGVFRSMLRSAQTQTNDKVATWILEVCFAQLKFGDVLSEALSVLIEATHYPMYLAMMTQMINKELKPYEEIITSEAARPLLLKFLGNDDGVFVCKSMGWLALVEAEWHRGEFLNYLGRVETALTVQLAQSSRQSNRRLIPVRAHEASALSEPGFTASELQWLFRMPWRIEVWAESSAGQVKLPLDSFIDCSRLRPEHELVSGGKGEDNSDGGICVVAYPSQKAGEKRVRPIVVPEDATLYACLTLANLPIDRRGRTTPPPSAGGGFPYTSATMRGEQAESGSFNNAVSGRLRAMTQMSRKNKSAQHPARRTSEELEPEGSFSAFAEATTMHEEAVMPLNDANFWVKCPPSMRLAASSSKQVFPVNPPDGACSFSFAPLGEMSSVDQKWDADEQGHEGESGEPVHRTVNPLVALKKSQNKDAPPPPPKEDLPPPLLLQMVRFNLELVSHRFASPSIPVHLLGELAKTETGAQAIAGMNVIDKFVAQIIDDRQSSVVRRAAFWALGHIGASECGFKLLKPEHIRAIIYMAVHEPTLSLRGTAVYALGLFSRSHAGCKALAEHGWATLDSKTHPFATIAVPAGKSASNFYKFDTTHTNTHVVSSETASLDGVVMHVSRGEPLAVENPVTDDERILALICDLSNHIRQKDATMGLIKLKDSPRFTDVKLMLAAHELLAKYAYQLPVRQFVANLFRVNLESERTWRAVDDEHLR